jgi:hypothetical protein
VTARLDVHLYVHHDEPSDRVAELLGQILTRLGVLERQESTILMNEQDLQNDLDAIRIGVNNLLASATAQAATIADLRAQLAAGAPVSQEQLDALDTEARAIVAALAPLATSAA